MMWTEKPDKICEQYVSGPWRVWFDGWWRVSRDGVDVMREGGAVLKMRAFWRDARSAKIWVEQKTVQEQIEKARRAGP